MKQRNSYDSFIVSTVVAASALLGFMIGFFTNPATAFVDEKKKKLEAENKDLKKQLNDSKARNKELEDKISTIQTSSAPKAKSVSKTTVSSKFDTAAAQKAFNKKVKENDFKIIEGIGPKIESIIKNRNIKTWQELSKADPQNIRTYLVEDGGERYHIHNPGTWPKQAKMAADGKWEALVKYQGTLTKGKTT